MKTVHVYAFEYCNGDSAGGGGFDWFWSESKADAAFRAADSSANAGHFRFSFETELTDAGEITDAIDAELIDRCAAAAVRRIGPVLLAYWQANSFRMGDAENAAA